MLLFRNLTGCRTPVLPQFGEVIHRSDSVICLASDLHDGSFSADCTDSIRRISVFEDRNYPYYFREELSNLPVTEVIGGA